jgi:hypothetical protein
MSKTISLGEIAHSRSGDKGNSSNIGVIARNEKDFPLLKEQLTAEKVHVFFKSLGVKGVKRYELPNLHALNFVLEGALAGGGSRSVRSDSQGKALGQAILEIPITIHEVL